MDMDISEYRDLITWHPLVFGPLFAWKGGRKAHTISSRNKPNKLIFYGLKVEYLLGNRNSAKKLVHNLINVKTAYFIAICDTCWEEKYIANAIQK